MMNRKLLITILVTLVYTTINLDAQVKEDLYLQNLVKQAIEISPKVKELASKQKISESKIPQVSNLPDPILKLGLANLPTNSFSFSQEPMTGKIIGLSQSMPFPGKLSTAEKAQAKNVKINQQEIDDKKNEIRKEISLLYYDLRFFREALRIAYENKELLKQIAEVVGAKYAVSKASQQNVIKVEVEITRVNDRIEELKGKELGIKSAINALLIRSSDTPVRTGSIPKIHQNEISTTKLESLSKENRPLLKGIKIAKQRAELLSDLAEYDFYPNFNFGIQYTQRDQIKRTSTDLNDLFSVFVGISLPINYGGKKTAKIEEAKNLQSFYSNKYEASFQFLQKMFGKSSAKFHELKQRETLIEKGLLPQAQQSLDAAIAGYQVNEIDFLNVVDAQNRLLEIETMLYKIRTDFYKEISIVEFLVGSSI